MTGARPAQAYVQGFSQSLIIVTARTFCEV